MARHQSSSKSATVTVSAKDLKDLIAQVAELTNEVSAIRNKVLQVLQVSSSSPAKGGTKKPRRVSALAVYLKDVIDTHKARASKKDKNLTGLQLYTAGKRSATVAFNKLSAAKKAGYQKKADEENTDNGLGAVKTPSTKTKKKPTQKKTAQKKKQEESDSDSGSESESEEEKSTPEKKAVPKGRKTVPKKKQEESESDSEVDSDSGSESESEDEDEKSTPAKKAAPKGRKTVPKKKQEESDSESESDSDAESEEETPSDSDDDIFDVLSEDEEEKTTPKPKNKKKPAKK
jgi:hypothetical protein